MREMDRATGSASEPHAGGSIAAIDRRSGQKSHLVSIVQSQRFAILLLDKGRSEPAVALKAASARLSELLSGEQLTAVEGLILQSQCRRKLYFWRCTIELACTHSLVLEVNTRSKFVARVDIFSFSPKASVDEKGLRNYPGWCRCGIILDFLWFVRVFPAPPRPL